MEKENIFFQRRAKLGKKTEEYIWQKNMFFEGEKNNSRGKGGKYLENENIFFPRREETQIRKRQNIFRDGKYLF